jgi:hypothetical protein
VPNNMPYATTSAPSPPAAPGALIFTPLSSVPPAAQPTKQTTHSAQSALSTSLLSTIQPNQPHKMRPWNPRSNLACTQLLLSFPLFSDGMVDVSGFLLFCYFVVVSVFFMFVSICR